MLEGFWDNESTVAAGSGWPLFGMVHLAALAVVACAVALMWRAFCRCSAYRQETFLRVMAMSVVATEIVRDAILAVGGVMSAAYLPLHLCSLSMFAYLAHAFLRPGRVRDAIAEVGVVLLLPGVISALLFPNWNALPPANFIFVHSFLSHGMLAAYPLFLLWSCRVRPDVHHAWWSAAALAVVTPAVAAFDVATGCNFLFVVEPLAGTPLEWLAGVMGGWWRVGYAILVCMVVLATYGVVGLWKRRHPAVRDVVRV